MARRSDEAGAIVRVRIPSPLRSYTEAPVVNVALPLLAPEVPPTLGGVLAALERRYQGIRFRMIDEQGRVRPHIKFFVGNSPVRDLSAPIPAGEEVMIVAALSGG